MFEVFEFSHILDCIINSTNMQKTALLNIIRQELIRALVFGLGFLTILSLGFIWIASAASGWIFWNILNNILASGNWETDTTGTVRNAEKLWNKLPTEFVKLNSNPANRSCAPKCVTWFDLDGSVQCAP